MSLIPSYLDKDYLTSTQIKNKTDKHISQWHDGRVVSTATGTDAMQDKRCPRTATIDLNNTYPRAGGESGDVGGGRGKGGRKKEIGGAFEG